MQIKSSKIILSVALTALFSFNITFAKTEPLVLKPTLEQEKSVNIAKRFLTRYHYLPKKLDDKLSAEIFKQYIETLDPNRSYFTKKDMKEFETYRFGLDDALLADNLQPAFKIFNRYRERVDERIAFAQKAVNKKFNFTKNESYVIDRKDSPWASAKELNKLWKKRVKNDVLQLKLTGKDDKKAIELISKRYANQKRRIEELDSEDVYQFFMNAFGAAIEPHTGYMSPRTVENFNISMSLSLEGIGAVLQREGEYTTIRSIVPGGPADNEGHLKVGDRIVAVSQENDPDVVDIVGWRVDDVVKLIRGDKGTEVQLTVLPSKEAMDGQHEIIKIVRDKVKLEQQAAQKKKVEIEQDGKMVNIGIIEVPTFYLDFAARARKDKDYRSTTRDVKKLIAELEEEGIDGLVIDLRNNGGGSLLEAIDLTGLFIDTGPVVQIRDSQGRVEIQKDEEPGQSYGGPLAVLVNRNSASASEIFSAAIQDYSRGIIIGEPTFGKGTVQDLINLDRFTRDKESQLGQLRLTMAQFFRISGGSTQNKGVIPDLDFMTEPHPEEIGESSMDNALPWTTIPPAEHKDYNEVDAVLTEVQSKHQQRIAKDEAFQEVLKEFDLFEENRNKKEISLNQEERQAILDKNKKDLEEVNPNHVDKNDSSNEEADENLIAENGNEEEAEEPDVLMDETVRILADYIELSKHHRLVELNQNKTVGSKL
ncbi:MAG: carboxy terminal-processing peptidase [bacterium]